MSKPMTKATLASMKDFAKRLHEDGYYDNHAKVNALIAEIERLQKLARPNREPKTRKRESTYCGPGYIGNDGYTHSQGYAEADGASFEALRAKIRGY